LGWFRAISLPHVTNSENGCRGAYKHEFLPPEPFLRFAQRTCPIHYFRSKTHVWGGFAQFRCRMSPIPKTVSGCIQSTSFRHRNHFFVLRNEHAQSTTLGPKLMFGVISRNFVAARHQFRKRVSGAYKHEFLPPNHFFVFRNEQSQSTTLRPKLMFGVVSRNFVVVRHPFPKRWSGVHTKHEFLPPEPILRFSQRTCPIHYFRSKTHVWGGFVLYRCRTSPIPKTGVGVQKSTSVCHQNHFVVFLQRTCPIHYFRSKTHVWVVSRNFVAARHSFRKWVSGCIQARVFATGTISSFCATNMPNPLL
jgi:RNA polymerase subunit RPABC4/transcription elongation factor Spt4